MKRMTLIFCLCLVLLLSSCTIGHIKDENGKDDISLCNLTDEDILADVSSYVQTGAFHSNTGKSAVYKAKKFSGVTTVKSIPYAVGERMIIHSNIEVDNGNLRVVLIQNDAIILDLPIGKDQTTVIEDSRRDYKIKIAGESAEFELEIEYEIVELNQ